MHLADTVTIVIAWPLLLNIADGGMLANDVVVALLFIGTYHSVTPCEGVDMVNHPQPYLAEVADVLQRCVQALQRVQGQPAQGDGVVAIGDLERMRWAG